jgi:hypothetical protein
MERIVRPLVEQGHEVQIWGDILREDLALAEKSLPAGVVALPWGYEAPWSEEQWQHIPESLREVLLRLEQDPRQGFRSQLEPLAGTDIPFWVAPGTASWNSLIGRVDTSIGNLVDASEAGTEFGAGGYLITDWGDNGHHQPPSVSFGPLVYGGAVSWSLRANRDLDLSAALDTFVFSDADRTLGGAIDRLGRMWRETGQMAFNSSPIFTALTRGAAPIGDADPDRCHSAVEEIDELVATVQRSAPACADAAAIQHELATAARLARHGVWRIMRKSGVSAPNDVKLRSDLSEAIAEQRAAWLARARPGGLTDSLASLEATLARYG